MSGSLLTKATEFALARLKSLDRDINRLPTPLQTVVVVTSAQGIIDNGGLEYFYECDFDGSPAYSFFVEAYRRIGAERAAQCIATSHQMFPFAEPHLHETARQKWLDTVRVNEEHAFVQLSRQVCGDEDVWVKLAEYVTANQGAFVHV